MATMLSVLIFFLCLPSMVFCDVFKRFHVPSGSPEGFVFDSSGNGPYTSVNDGRIVYFNKSISRFVDYAYASPTRNKTFCDGKNVPALTPVCGRTIGLGMYQKTKELYLLDPYHGLCVVGPQGGLATPLATEADGEPFKLLDGIDVDQNNGDVYFTDASAIYDLQHIGSQVANRDSTARLLKYDPKTKEVTVLLRNLSGAGGAGVANDSSYVLVSEFTGEKIRKYYLKGPKKGTAEIILNVKGPCNVKRNSEGDFWVAVNFQIPYPVPAGIRIDGNGTILEMVSIGKPYNRTFITEVQQYGDALFIGSMVTPFGGIYKD